MKNVSLAFMFALAMVTPAQAGTLREQFNLIRAQEQAGPDGSI